MEELALSRAAFVPGELVERVELWDAQIVDALEADRRKTFSNDQHATAVVSLKAFFEERADVVDAWLAEGGHCP